MSRASEILEVITADLFKLLYKSDQEKLAGGKQMNDFADDLEAINNTTVKKGPGRKLTVTTMQDPKTIVKAVSKMSDKLGRYAEVMFISKGKMNNQTSTKLAVMFIPKEKRVK